MGAIRGDFFVCCINRGSDFFVVYLWFVLMKAVGGDFFVLCIVGGSDCFVVSLWFMFHLYKYDFLAFVYTNIILVFFFLFMILVLV